MFSIIFEGGDGAKHPELFKQGLKFVKSKVPIIGYVTVSDDGLTSITDRTANGGSNYISTQISNRTLSNINNIEFQIKFYFTKIVSYQMLIATQSYSEGIGFGATNQGFIGLNGYSYPTLNPSYTLETNKIYYSITRFTKSTNTTEVKLYDENMDLITQYSYVGLWFSNNDSDWRFGYGQEYNKYPTYANYDLKETWIKDLDTDEILVPWLE